MTLALKESITLQKVPVSPEPLYRLLFGRPMTEILLAALDLKIFEELSHGPRDLHELTKTLNLPVHSTDMLLNTCVAIGLLGKEDSRFKNSPLADQFLVNQRPFYLGGLIEHFRMHVYPAWSRLKEAVLEDGPQISKGIGNEKGNIFEITDKTDQSTELFISAMHNLSVSDGLILAEEFNFSSYKQLLDIGGGSGALSLAVAARYPHLKAIVFDRPQVSPLAKRYIEAANLEDRVATCPGDAFLDPFPAGTDLILLSLFIHAFGLERSTPILEKCFRTLPPGGGVLIYEPMLDPNRTGPLTTLLSSLNMLVVTPSGGDVTAQDYMHWLEGIGFESVFYKSIPAVRHLVGGYKPKH